MSAPAVVPRPAALRFRDFLQRGGPILVMVFTAAIVAFLWNRELFPSNFIGEVQAPSSTLISPKLGRVAELLADQFDVVTNGQPLARIAVVSDDALKANLAVLKGELEIMKVRMLQDQERNDLNRLQMQNELLLQRLGLAESKLQLRQAEAELERARVLFEKGILSAGVADNQAGYETALLNRDLYRTQVEEKTKLVSELELALSQIRPAQDQPLSRLQEAIASALKAQEASLQLSDAPDLLRSPIDGMVMKVYRRRGDNTTEGEPLFEIRGTKPGWILGFIRQPISAEPQVGASIQVRSRGHPQQTGTAQVLKVGAHLEVFSQPLRVRGFDASQERGLPVILSFPDNLKLHPGELVDLVPVPAP